MKKGDLESFILASNILSLIDVITLAVRNIEAENCLEPEISETLVLLKDLTDKFISEIYN